MKKYDYIHLLLSYIEGHLSETLQPESIAGRYFVSTSQLYRDFYACTGHSVKEYIRRRRISNACEKIKCSDLPFAVIADESGYQTQQAFYKQFKTVVGMTPLEYRQSESYFYFYPLSFNGISIAVKVGKETIPACRTTRFYDSCLTGIEDRALAAVNGLSGRVFGRNGKQCGSRFCYEVMTETTGTGTTDLYATCVVNYNESEISDGWNYLYNKWLSASMFEESGSGYFEEYIFQNGRPYRLKLYLPVRKQKEEKHITITCETGRQFVIARARGYGAEKKASEAVISFLRERYPLLIQNARRFYVCTHEDIWTCGIECGEGFCLPYAGDTEVIHIPQGRYAVLPDDRLGDICIGSAKMDLWLKNNGISHKNEPVFAVYEIMDGKFDTEHLRMRLYKRL